MHDFVFFYKCGIFVVFLFIFYVFFVLSILIIT